MTWRHSGPCTGFLFHCVRFVASFRPVWWSTHRNQQATKRRSAMAYSRTFFRDRIVLNNDLKTRTKLDTLPMGSTLLFAAREVVIDGTLSLDGRNLVLLADRFDGSRGKIQVKALPDGSAGPKVTVICRKFAGATITSTGGKGLQGETGAPGREGRPGRPAPL